MTPDQQFLLAVSQSELATRRWMEMLARQRLIRRGLWLLCGVSFILGYMLGK
jgi:hypothetical protein